MKQDLIEIESISRLAKDGRIPAKCSGWNYPETLGNGGWTRVVYPDKNTKRIRYYSQFFNTAGMASTFCEI